MYFEYKNSKLATIISLIGCGLVTAGIAGYNENSGASIGAILVGIPIAILGRQISRAKSFKTWWKQIENNNLEPVIAQDLDTAISIYKKNPQRRTLKKIESLNPQFAAHIKQNIVGQK